MRVNNRKPLRSSSRVAQPPSAVITGGGAGATQQADLHAALRDLLAYQNRRGDEGWSSADVRRMNEIRDLAK